MIRYIQFLGAFVITLGFVMMVGCNSVMDGDINEEPVTEVNSITTANDGKSTVVPGHRTDDGSIPVGTVNGKYTSVYAWDANEDWFWDLGDGRVYGTVNGIDELDDSSLTVCNYIVIYRGDFEGSPFLANGWIRNNIKCSGYAYDRTQTFNYLIVHETDPRYSEDLKQPWDNWGYLVYAVGGVGNIANPQHPVNN